MPNCWCHHNHCGCGWPTRHPCETCDCCHSLTRQEADKARDKAVAALERADRKVRQHEAKLREMYERATGRPPQ